ncbi:hypothetical protein EROM_041020 [Encephalitozoon romaleae SJ-2008]|uniref:Uncharacterized protein n=1 Tax=Encephalitozoon romaleae (strain SJ-2008) TaxID=1178016 RepID=I7AME0_ENCRO|nr:hypothetical protein EROM_041020 [Encephalitozoon romaleae SJ-2008]AFN82869.1 hypothetical protein EROM_041020 [Encephalitozoon romaleae SJ-2008]
MLILTNISREMNFEASKVNGRVFLKGDFEGIEYKGSEWNSPCYYCVVESSNGVIDLGRAEEARIVVFETVYETGVSHKKTSLKELAFTFGGKRLAGYHRRKEIDGYSKRVFTSSFKFKDQILPPMDEEAECPKKRFVLERMFPKEVLSSFEEIKVDSVLLHPDLMGLKQNMSYKTHFLLADCIIKLMEKKYITNDCLNDSGYSSFFAVIENEVENKMLTPLCRDKLAILCYILFLQIQGFSVKYEVLPDFKFSKKKVISMHRLIGCLYYSQSDTFKLK